MEVGVQSHLGSKVVIQAFPNPCAAMKATKQIEFAKSQLNQGAVEVGVDTPVVGLHCYGRVPATRP
jgi:hypothetical protein